MPRSFVSNPHVRLLAAILCAFSIGTQTTQSQDLTPENLSSQAVQLLHQRCFSCHNEEDRKGGLILTSRAAIDSANAEFDLLVAGDPESSFLIEVLAPDADPHMPPKEQIAPNEIQILKDWVSAGAQWDEGVKIDESAVPPPAPRSAISSIPRSFTPVLALGLSPDGRQLASGLGTRILISQAPFETEKRGQILSGHRDLVRSLSWNPIEPGRLASGGYQRILYWDTLIGEPLQIIEADILGQVSALEFSADGTRLYAGISRPGLSGTLLCWSVPGFELLHRLEAHADTIFAMDLSPDGNYLATASGDRNIAFWETDTWQERSRIEAHSTQIMALSFSPDSRKVVTAGTDQQLRVWDWVNRDPLFNLGRHKRGLFAAHWLPSGNSILASDEKGTVYRYTEIGEHSGAASARAAKESRLTTMTEIIQCLAYGPTNDTVFIGTQNGLVKVLNAKGKLIANLENPL